MGAQGSGSIINISSGAADPNIAAGMPPGYLTYSVAKAALERFSTALAIELAPMGIAVNALRPGAVKTRDERARARRGLRLDRLEDTRAVVPAVNYLAEQDGNGFTGRIVDSTQFGIVWP